MGGRKKKKKKKKKGNEVGAPLLNALCVVCGLSLLRPRGSRLLLLFLLLVVGEGRVRRVSCVSVCVSRSSLHAQQPPHALHLRRTFSHESRQREGEGPLSNARLRLGRLPLTMAYPRRALIMRRCP